MTFALFSVDSVVYRTHPFACCDSPPSLVHGEHYLDDCCRSAEDKARSHFHGNLRYVGHQPGSAGFVLSLVDPVDDTSFVADSDEECGSEGTDDESEGDSDEKEEPTFIDLDRQDTQVRYEVGPDKLLKGLTAYLPTTEDDQVLYLAPFEEAIHNDDFEAFVQIAELSAKLPNPVILAELRCEDMLLSKNRVRLLDEYIRRTGNGIDVPQKKTGGTDDAPERPKGKEYWGLNVHGKKRRDLAARGDPNVWSNGGSRFPLVWRAAAFGGLDVLEYLKTDRPLAAYQYYFSMNPKEAKKADLPALESSISELLGWCANPSNETALNAALHWRELNSFKKLLDLNPTLLKPYSQKRYSARFLMIAFVDSLVIGT